MRRALIFGFITVLMTEPSTTQAHAESLTKLCPGFSADKITVQDGAPAGAERFAGIFVGKWANQLDHVLAVEHISSDGHVKAHYAWGAYAPWGDTEAACVQRPGQYQDGVLRIRLSQDRHAIYKLSATDVLAGEYYFRNSLTVGTFARHYPESETVSAPAPMPQMLAFPSGYVSELLETDLLENGRAVRLQFVTLKPDGPGPFPLLLFNHGSTGRGDVPEAARAVHLPDPLARHFLAKGWMIASPQRRGRGWSDGLYDEGFTSDRSRYSGEQDVTLAGFERALADIEAAMKVLRARPDVDARQVVIGGQSRGGVLSLAYAARHPERVKGVINFVGGWLNAFSEAYAQVHRGIADDAAASPIPSLWLYGGKDQLYDLETTRSVYGHFRTAGGVGEFVAFPDAGHGLMWETVEWTAPVDRFMAAQGFPEFAK